MREPPREERRREPAQGIGEPAGSIAVSRVLLWEPVAGATEYSFRLFRRGTRIFEATPSEPRVTVPVSWTYRGARFRLTPAEYRWEVRAITGAPSDPPGGSVVVESMWVVSGETAATG